MSHEVAVTVDGIRFDMASFGPFAPGLYENDAVFGGAALHFFFTGFFNISRKSSGVLPSGMSPFKPLRGVFSQFGTTSGYSRPLSS